MLQSTHKFFYLADSMTTPAEDYENIVKYILKLEVLTGGDEASKVIIVRYQKQLDKISSKYTYAASLDYLYVAFYELQALLFLAKDDAEAALKFLTEAADIKPHRQDFTSLTAQGWYNEQLEQATSSGEEMYNKTMGKKRHFTKRVKVILWGLGGVLILLMLLAGPISDYMTISNADPAMLKLAQEAGMTKQGELIFLRTNPLYVDDAQLALLCPDAQTNQNGFIEQGCFIPDQSNPTTGRIYIRKMNSDLHNLEVTTAAYEMLHPAYIALTQQSDGGAALNKSIESNLSSLSDNDLQAQVANFAKTEPGERDLELFSILGTEYSGISSALAAYYSPYISNLNTDVSLNNQVNQLFENDAARLTSLQDTINQTDANAKTAYRYSVQWAYEGNQYENTYNYNIYSKDIDLENSYIDQYNILLDEYNVLVTEFNGQQFKPNSQIQTQ